MEIEQYSPETRVKVVLPIPTGDGYDYKTPKDQILSQGDFVEVSLGYKKQIGVIFEKGLSEKKGGFPKNKLKTISKRIEKYKLSKEMLDFIKWVSAYTMSPIGAVLKMAMSISEVFEDQKKQKAYLLNANFDENQIKMTQARKRVLEFADIVEPTTKQSLIKASNVSSSVIDGLEKQKVLLPVLLEEEIKPNTPNPYKKGLELNRSQAVAALGLSKKINDDFSVSLLDGITGSGKTEVYFEAIAKALMQEKQILVLVPEISLTSQWLQRFMKRFGSPPFQWHSSLGKKTRRQTWKGVYENKVKVVVGARSALFLPYKDLGLIIVDEEHEQSYKQEEGVIYHGRDMAIVRAKIEKCPIILASATPSLETINNVEEKRFDKFVLKNRYAEAVLPSIDLINMKKNPPIKQSWGTSWISPILVEEIKTNLKDDFQTMLFLNRRGYAPLTLCRSCGFRLQCPSCSAWLVEHKKDNSLRCHHCDYAIRIPQKCPECEEEDSFVACGPGVERIAEEIKNRFPEAKTALITSDSLKTNTQAKEIFKKIVNREIDILIGTQLLAKGHNFPHLTLVGVIDADLGLAGGDLRASEKTFQLLNQVAGRAGRAEWTGRVMLQTYQPENQVIKAISENKRDEFISRELEIRRALEMPPFGRLVAIIVSSKNEDRAKQVASQLGISAPDDKNVRVMGPSPAPLYLLRDKYRYRLLMKTSKTIKPQKLIKDWVSKIKKPSNVKIQIDVDPYTFF